MSCNLVETIIGSECIGDSRNKINSNFVSLETVVCNLSTSPLNILVTDTIQHTFTPSARQLSSVVRNDSIDSIHLKSDSVTTAKLSAEAVTTDKIALSAVTTQTIANSAITAEKMSGGQSGSAPVYGIRAWAVYDGSGTGAGPATIKQAGNISSVDRVQDGVWVITFTQDMPDTDYAVIGSGSFTQGSVGLFFTIVQDVAGIPVLKTTKMCCVQICSTEGNSSSSNTTSVMFIG